MFHAAKIQQKCENANKTVIKVSETSAQHGGCVQCVCLIAVSLRAGGRVKIFLYQWVGKTKGIKIRRGKMMKETLYDNDKNDGDKNDGIGIPAKKRSRIALMQFPFFLNS